jgi:hypothetical protein
VREAFQGFEVNQVWTLDDFDRLIKGMPVDCESPKPLRPDVKAPRPLPGNEQEEEHAQTKEAEHDHFGFSVPQTHLHANTPLPGSVAAVPV